MFSHLTTVRKGSWNITATSQQHALLAFRPHRATLTCRAVDVQQAGSSVQTLQDKIAQLQRENEALKKELSKLQRSPTVPAKANIDLSPMNAAAAIVEKLKPISKGSLMAELEKGINWPSPGDKFWETEPRSSPFSYDLGPNNLPAPPKDPKPLHIVHLTAEMAPLAKVGGLGDVVTGLARTCLARGHNVSIILPFYECIDKSQIEGLKHEVDIDVPKGFVWDGQMQVGALRTSVWWGRIAGCPVYLIRPANWDQCNLFRGGRIYGGSYNELEAYLYFCRAALEYLQVSGQQPHVLHIHEWQTCAAALLYWEVYNPAGLWRPRVVLTVHNMDNSGECRQDEFMYAGMPGEQFASVDKALDERTIGHNPERLNLMKGGLVYSNAVTTVSPGYAREVLTGGAAGHLRGTICRPEIQPKVSGILNGIDVEEWDPSRDAYLPAPFSASQPEGKALCKKFVQMGLGLDVVADKPLVVVISRLVPQKGIHLMRAAVGRTLSRGGQFVLLGSGHSDGPFRGLADGELKGSRDARLLIMYSERLAHMLYAAADFVLVPSMFEPCGLTQLIAMRYGAAPVVRRTGGLADTVNDVDASAEGEGNGYVFDGTDEGSLFAALDRALDTYKSSPQRWRQLSTSNMQLDCSWNRSAGDYVQVYTGVASD